MGLGYKAAGIPCLVILLASTISYSLLVQTADAKKEGEIVAIELSPKAGEKDWISIRNGFSYPYSFKGWSIVNSLGQIFTLPPSTVQPGETLSFVGYNMFMACEDLIELHNAANIVVDSVGNLCDFDDDENYWYKSWTGEWVFSGSAATGKASGSITTDETLYKEDSKVCINGSNISAEFAKLEISSGDGSSFWTIFPKVSAGTFRECFNVSSYLDKFAYGVWMAELYNYDQLITLTLFGVIPTEEQEQDAGDRVKVQQTSPLSPPCFTATGIPIRDKWYVLVGLIDRDGKYIHFDFPQVNNRSISYCVPKDVLAHKFAILDPSGLILVKQYGREDSVKVTKKEFYENEEICYTAVLNPSFIGSIELRIYHYGSLFHKKELQWGTYSSFEGCITPVFKVDEWKLSLVGIVLDENRRQKEIILTEDDFRTIAKPAVASKPSPQPSPIEETPRLVISTHKKTYHVGEDVNLIILVNPVIPGEKISFDILNPSKELYLTQSAIPNSEGTYQFSFTLQQSSMTLAGIWAIKVNYGGIMKELDFEVRQPITTPENEKGEKQNLISVAMKLTKKSTLLAIKNADDVEVYSIKIKANDGNIRFVKAKAWDREKVDPSTVMIKTTDRPILPGRSLFVMLVTDNKGSGIEWTAYDVKGTILSSGALIPK